MPQIFLDQQCSLNNIVPCSAIIVDLSVFTLCHPPFRFLVSSSKPLDGKTFRQEKKIIWFVVNINSAGHVTANTVSCTVVNSQHLEGTG